MRMPLGMALVLILGAIKQSMSRNYSRDMLVMSLTTTPAKIGKSLEKLLRLLVYLGNLLPHLRLTPSRSA